MTLGGAIYRSINLLTDKVSQADAAQIMQVSVPSIAHAKKVLTEGTPGLAQAVEQGEVTVCLRVTTKVERQTGDASLRRPSRPN